MNGETPQMPAFQGGDSRRRVVQFFNKSSDADKLTIEWFLDHNAVCCICRSVIDACDKESFGKHPRLEVVVCSNCASTHDRSHFLGAHSCGWCGRDTSGEQFEAGRSKWRVCCSAGCSNRICDGCLRSNFTKVQVERTRISWTCFDCDPQSIAPHLLYAECLLEFARIFRQPVIPKKVSFPNRSPSAQFLNSVKTVLLQLNRDPKGGKLPAKDLEEHIRLAQRLHKELNLPQESAVKQEPELQSASTVAESSPRLSVPPPPSEPRDIEPPSSPPSIGSPPEIPCTSTERSSVGLKSEIVEPQESTPTQTTPQERDDETRPAEVKTELDATLMLPRQREDGSDADSNETLHLNSSAAERPTLVDEEPEDDDLNRLLGNINRRHFSNNNKDDSGTVETPSTETAPPNQKTYEEPFLSSDEENDVLNLSGDAGQASCSRDYGPLIVLSSDDELLACNSPDDDDEDDVLSPGSSDERSGKEKGKNGGEAAVEGIDEAGTSTKAGTVAVRRKSIPSIPGTPSTSKSTKNEEVKRKDEEKTEGNKTKRKYLSDESLSDDLLSDLESVNGEPTPEETGDAPTKASTKPAKKKKRCVSLVSEESESDDDAAEKRTDRSPKKFTKQAVRANKTPVLVEPETCIISSDDEDFIPPPPISRVTVKTEAGTPVGRKNIREMMSSAQLSKATIEANSREKERRRRIEEMQKKYNQFEIAEPETGEDVKCVLEFDLATKEALVQVHPQLSRRMKAHQLDGVKFLYQNLVESVAKLQENSPGTGAILGHCMGLGKTFQVVCFLHTLMTHPKLKDHFDTVLVISPLNVIATWQEEISRWVERDPGIPAKLTQYNLHKEPTRDLRMCLLRKWQRSGGIMLMTPNLLTCLLGRETQAGKRKNARAGVSADLIQQFKTHLCDPGPKVLIVDEGHTLKKDTTQLTQIVDKMIKTSRKILLTGTPLQNNLTEYFTMVSIVSPHLLGTKNEYRNRFENPITNGQYKNSTPADIRRMRQRASVLKKLLENVVHRRDLSVLQSILPPRHDYVITIRLSAMQEALYEKFLALLVAKGENSQGNTSLRRLLQDFVSLRSVWTHPKLLTMPKKVLQKKKNVATVSDMLGFDSITPGAAAAEELNGDWFKPIIGNEILDDVTLGPKIFILCDIIQNCGMIGDKLVVFCTQLSALDLVEFMLGLMSKNNIGEGHWVVEKDYFRMDGSTSADDRHRFFNMFNNPDNTRARLFLVSTNAGKLGSTLVGANRMVLLDTSWNPADDNQAVYRIYRIGQKKPVFIYRFVSFGTMEEKIYARNILKESQSARVLDDSNMERHFTHEDVRDLYTFTPYDASAHKTPSLPKDVMLAELILRHKNHIAAVHEHQQLLQNLEDDLSEEDRRIAWDEYEREKEAPQAAPAPVAPNSAAVLGLASGVNSADFRVVDWCVKHWNATETTDIERLRIAAQFRNAVNRCREHNAKGREKMQALLGDALRRQETEDVTRRYVQSLRIFNTANTFLVENLTKIDQLIQRSQQTPIPRNNQQPRTS